MSSRINEAQFQYVQLDERDRFQAEIRPLRINNQADPELPKTLEHMDHFNRVLYAESYDEILKITLEYAYCFQGGDIAIVPGIGTENAKLYAWNVVEQFWGPLELGNVATIPYTNIKLSSVTTVKEALDLLVLGKPEIKYFKNNIGVVEKGSVIHNLKLEWSLNRIATNQSMNFGIGDLNQTTRALVLSSANLYEDSTFTLFVSDESGEDSISTTIFFRDKIFYGTSQNDTITEAELLTFNSKLQEEIYFLAEFDCKDEYIYYAIPKDMDTPIFMPFELVNNSWQKSELTIINKHGQTVVYDIYRSEYKFDSSNIIISII